MSGPQSTSGGGLFRINVTPIIDVALTLVIILLLTAPMLSVPNLELELPQAQSRGEEQRNAVTLTLDRDGQLAVDDRVVTREELEAVLRERLQSADNPSPDALVVLRADSQAPFAAVQALMAQARAAGATRVAVATRLPFEPVTVGALP